MSVFNVPVVRTFNEVERSFPRLLMPDIEALGVKLVAERKKRTKATYKSCGFTDADLPGLLLKLELEDYDEYQAVAVWSQKLAGARAILTASWVKGGGKEGDIFGPGGFLSEEYPRELSNLAWEVLSPPAPAKKKDEPKNPPEGENAPASDEV